MEYLLPKRKLVVLHQLGNRNWLLLNDDGQDGDRVAGDGIYSIKSMSALVYLGRDKLPCSGVRYIPINYTAESQTYTIELVDEKASGGVGTNWIAENSTTLVLIGLLMLLALGHCNFVTMEMRILSKNARRILISPYTLPDVNKTSAVIQTAIALSALASPIIAASSPDKFYY
ncbi:MAG: hypothetical protein Ct9H90mP14_0290 [Methanobacteriota archaeon]|nr:MAG: hypothetical protein Ct9H90mP14_0290 [Euryarchaeota archaeon]